MTPISACKPAFINAPKKVKALAFAGLLLMALLPAPAMAQSSIPAPLPTPSPAAPARQSNWRQPAENPYYLQCAARMSGVDQFPEFRSPEGLLGIFQFDLYSAWQAGLCRAPVPRMRHEQVWKLCDFQGPVAIKYNLRNHYDLRYDGQAAAAQFEMMQNLNRVYDRIIYEREYDRYFGQYISGVQITIEMLRGMLHARGPQAVDEFLYSQRVKDKRNHTPYTLAICLQQCLNSKARDWFCHR